MNIYERTTYSCFIIIKLLQTNNPIIIKDLWLNRCNYNNFKLGSRCHLNDDYSANQTTGFRMNINYSILNCVIKIILIPWIVKHSSEHWRYMKVNLFFQSTFIIYKCYWGELTVSSNVLKMGCFNIFIHIKWQKTIKKFANAIFHFQFRPEIRQISFFNNGFRKLNTKHHHITKGKQTENSSNNSNI